MELGNLHLTDDAVIVLGTSVGTKIGTATNQKLAFYGVTPITQPSGDVLSSLSSLGLISTPTLAVGDLTIAGHIPTSSTATTPVAGDNSTLIATTAFVQGQMSNITVNVAGNTNVNLTDAQTNAFIITFTGALTGNIQVFASALANSGDEWIVQNLTTGNYTITFIGQTGTGIIVPQNCATWLFYDATNMQYCGSSVTTGKSVIFKNAFTFSGTDNTTFTLPATSDTLAGLGTAETWTALQTFGNNISLGGKALAVSGLATNQVLVNNGLNWVNAAIANSVSNSDGSLTISPTTGSVVASLNTSHANTWSAVQTFNSSDLAVLNPAATFSYTIVGSAITAGYNLTLPLITSNDTFDVLGLAQTFTATKTFSACNIATDTTTGMKIGTATTQKIGFFNSTPIVQPSGDIITALSNLGLIASPSIASFSAKLSADVTMTSTNTYYDGPSLTGLANGTYFVVAYITVTNSATNQGIGCQAKLWDGTTVYASGQSGIYSTNATCNSGDTITLSAVMVITNGTIKISAATCFVQGGANTGIIRAATTQNGSGNNASAINAIKIA